VVDTGGIQVFRWEFKSPIKSWNLSVNGKEKASDSGQSGASKLQLALFKGQSGRFTCYIKCGDSTTSVPINGYLSGVIEE